MKGNVIVGQSGGPTAVINASLAGVYRMAKACGAGKVYGMRYGVEGLLERSYIDLSDQLRSELDIELLKRTPSSYLGSCRYKLPEITENENVYRQLFEILDELEIGAFFYIGGNDSMDTIKKLSDYGAQTGSTIRFIGVPKTIDNDLAMTDHTPGYGSAAKYIATVSKEIIRDARVYNCPAVTIIEIMGRNAGWLTAASALAKGEDCEGVDLICLPEAFFDMDRFIERVKTLTKERTSIVIAVSEGVRLADGRYVTELTDQQDQVDVFGHKQLQGVGKYLADCIAAQLGIKTRAIELSTLQRCASHIASQVDVAEAFAVGGAAVQAAENGASGSMVVLERMSGQPYLCRTGLQDIHKIANVEKTVPASWIAADGMQVTEELTEYIRPLIQEEPAPIMTGGVPRHLRLAD